MYEFSLAQVYGKPSDFKICNNCKNLNWYDNEECVNLDCIIFTPKKEGFDISEKAVIKFLKEEYDFYMNEEGYSESETDNILIEA